MSRFDDRIIEEFRANKGKVGGRFAGASLLLLTTTGRRSGEARVAPLAYLADGDRYVVVGSNGGKDTDPAWVTNLQADPTATVEVGSRTFPADVTVLTEGPERDRLYTAIATAMPGFAAYQEATQRVIPVVVLAPKG